MKIRDLIFTMFIVSIIVNSAIIVAFASGKVNQISEVTSKSSSDTLKNNAAKSLIDTAIGLKDSLDSQLTNHYTLVKTWASNPLLQQTSKEAQKYSKEALYEMWSAQSTRVYDEGEATGDGNPDNDLSSTASKYLITLSTMTGVYPEIFTTDNRGYAIAANVATGDFDQGPDDWRVFLNEAGQPYFKQNKPGVDQEPWYYAANQAVDGFYISKTIYDESSGTWGLELVSQMRDPTSLEYLGQIKAVFDFSKFVGQLVNVEDLAVDEIQVIDASGKVIADSDGKAVSGDLATIDSAFMSEINKGKNSGYVARVDEEGNKVITAYARSNDKNKYVVAVSKRESDIDMPINSFVDGLTGNIKKVGSELQMNIIIIAAVVGLLTLLVAFVVINAQIVDPVNRLSEVADKLTDGDFSVSMPEIKTRNEIQKFSALTALLVSIIKQGREGKKEEHKEEKKEEHKEEHKKK
ncbi:MAG: HAMP domain-containing protein [archaeon]